MIIFSLLGILAPLLNFSSLYMQGFFLDPVLCFTGMFAFIGQYHIALNDITFYFSKVDGLPLWVSR